MPGYLWVVEDLLSSVVSLAILIQLDGRNLVINLLDCVRVSDDACFYFFMNNLVRDFPAIYPCSWIAGRMRQTGSEFPPVRSRAKQVNNR
jgi:hypothetical protein